MKTHSTIRQWGQNDAISIPPNALRLCGLQIGQAVEVEISENGTLTVRPITEPTRLEDLLAKATPENLPDAEDIEWGKPQGTEIG
jgi:antitoxin component of MazEF toxin-antitoxin module